jgi:hypothetical protein
MDDLSVEQRPMWVVLAPVVAILLVLAYFVAIKRLPYEDADFTTTPSLPCDRPEDESAECEPTPALPPQDGRAYEIDRIPPTPLEADQRPFVRIDKPRDEIRLWSTFGGLASVGSLVLGAIAVAWLRGSRPFTPRPGLSLKSPWSLAWGLGIAATAVGFTFSNLPSTGRGSALVIFTMWVGAVPALIGVFNCWVIVNLGADQFVGPDRDHESLIVELRDLHERYVTLLGTQVTLYVLWLSAREEALAAIHETALARMGGTFLRPPAFTSTVVALGLLFTALLAVCYLPTASCLRRIARRHVKMATEDVDWTDYRGAADLVAARSTAVGLDYSLPDRFQKTVVVAAPLISAILPSVLSL